MEEIGETTEKEIEKRKKDLINFFKQKTNLIFYGILAIIISISVYIRTRPIPKLKDITTGTWTLGPDLDPFLFLRWAKYIVEHGKLFLLDTMRYIPLADICSGDSCNPVNTAGEMKLLPYMIAWLSKFLTIFNNDVTVTYAAIIFPVIMAVLTGIAFFLFARKIFYKEDKKTANIIAIIATTFFVLIPSLLPRTIAGIPEKESAAFFFIFIGFYFFLEAFTSKKLKRGLIFGTLAGISTGLLGLIWGGVTFMFLIISGAVLFKFIMGKMDNKKFLSYLLWIVSAVIVMIPFSTRYTPLSLIVSISTGLSFMILFILFIDRMIFGKKILNIHRKLEKIKLPHRIISIIISFIVVGIIASIVFGITFIPDIIKNIISETVHPLAQSRFGITVAENKQPYFISEWAGEFGPVVFNIPLYFWLFFIGSVFLFNYLIKTFGKKEKIILTFSYILFLTCLIFSKYAPSPHPLNGNGALSLLVYFGGFLFFITSLGYFYYKKYKERKISIFSELNFAYVFYLVTITMGIIAARGAVRLIMVLGAVSPIAVAFLIVKISKRYFEEKEDVKKLFTLIVALLVLFSSVFTVWAYYQDDINTSRNYVPGIYQWQWQKAMEWIRENTQQDAVFAHWWDYGYWIQSIGERATILDGGNAIGYWNHFMGRNVLTGTNEKEALDFLYAHNGTHLLIDPTDIGKYGAFSSIGSDEDYDRYSWIPTIFLDESQTQETNNETIHVYSLNVGIDEDIIINDGEKDILLPKEKAGVIAILLREDIDGEIKQPRIFFVYNENQYQMPLRYVYVDDELHDFEKGIDAGIFIFPQLDSQNGQITVNKRGAAFYLSKRTVHSELARLYLFDEKSDYFKLAHTEQNLIVDQLHEQGINVGDFVYYNGFQGPIKIWEISYPKNIKLNESYLNTDFPAELDSIGGD